MCKALFLDRIKSSKYITEKHKEERVTKRDQFTIDKRFHVI